MPGYMMHLCEGSYIIQSIKNTAAISGEGNTISLLRKGFQDADFTSQFLMGNILPDAVSDKSATHFRPACQNNLITKYPDIQFIINSYPIEQMTPADLGVLAHLYMDSLYVTEFWPRYFTFEDISDTATCVTSEIDHVRMHSPSIQREGTCIPIKEFFSEKYFYGDYNITNPLFLRDFAPLFPDDCSVYLSITECRAYSQEQLRRDLNSFVKNKVPGSSSSCNVFPYEDLHRFITDCSAEFLRLINQHQL